MMIWRKRGSPFLYPSTCTPPRGPQEAQHRCAQKPHRCGRRRRREAHRLWPCSSTHNAQIDCTESLSTQVILICSLISGGRPGSGHRADRGACAVAVRWSASPSVKRSVVSFLKHSYAIPSPFSTTIILSHLRPHQSSPQAIVQAYKEAYYSHDHTGVLDNHTSVHAPHERRRFLLFLAGAGAGAGISCSLKWCFASPEAGARSLRTIVPTALLPRFKAR